MKIDIKEHNGKIILSGITDFNLAETLDCGQCFRAFRVADNHYKLITKNKLLNISGINGMYELFPCDINEFNNIWSHYFDLNRDYFDIKQNLSLNDKTMMNAISYANGIRILNQDPWETLISFIISQNSQIARIKQVISNICRMFGDKISDNEYCFPSVTQLSSATINDFTVCKAGFRAAYLADAVSKVASGCIDLDAVAMMTTIEARNVLTSIKGVGQKVADCVLTYAYGRCEVFATDVWIKRSMEYFYFDKQEQRINKILEYAAEKFRNNAAFAQIYLFHYSRLHPEIFAKDKSKL